MEVQEFNPIYEQQEKKKIFEGVPCEIRSEVKKVTIEGIEHRAKVIVVDFRAEKKENGGVHDRVVVHVHGIGNSSKLFNEAADRGDFSGSENTLEYQAIKEAKESRGIYIQNQLLELPAVEEVPSFKEDARVHLAFLEQEGIKLIQSDVTINGYSEGAGVAKYLAKLVEEKQTDETEYSDKLRLFSLTGIVPVAEIHKNFSDHVWSQVIMAEAARRINEVFPEWNKLEKQIATSKDQMIAIAEILREITIGERKDQARAQLKEALKGNLDILMDVGRRFAGDLKHGPRHLRKFFDREIVSLDDRWSIDMRLPYKDGVYPLGTWLESMGLTTDRDFDLIDQVSFMKEIIANQVFEKVSQITLEVFGGPWYDSVNYHTGPTDKPELFYRGEGVKRVTYVKGNREEMPVGVEELMADMAI
ncbi:MAG TPA: hypothetical protein VF837_00425 [Patescibacteria group bacterium]